MVTCLETAEGGAARRGTATECLLPWESVFVLVRITSELDGVELYKKKKIKIGVGYNGRIELTSSLFNSELIVYYVNFYIQFRPIKLCVSDPRRIFDVKLLPQIIPTGT